MNKKRIILTVFFLLAALGVLVGADVYLHVRKDGLLKQVVEKKVADTTEEKGLNIYERFQVYKNRLYENSEKGFGYTDLETGKREILTQKDIYDFVICDDLIYYLDINKVPERVICKNLDGVGKKERIRILRNIESYFLMNKEVIALRERKSNHAIIKWGQDGSEQVLLEFGFDVIEKYQGQLCGYYEGKYIFFCNEGVYAVDGSTGEVQRIFSVGGQGSVGCVLKGVRCVKDKVYIWGIARDSDQTALCGPYYVEDSELTGVWQVNLNNYEAERISDVYYDEMCVLQGELYGVEDMMFDKKKLIPVSAVELSKTNG